MSKYITFRNMRSSSGSTIIWTDSTCVLRWIEALPTWTTFVANRISKIQTITAGCQWSHVPRTLNPADLISRGLTHQDSLENRFWWQGPAWLEDGPDQWPRSPEILSTREVEDEKRRTVIAGTVSTITEFINMYSQKMSSCSDLVRCTAYWLSNVPLMKL